MAHSPNWRYILGASCKQEDIDEFLENLAKHVEFARDGTMILKNVVVINDKGGSQ